MGTICEEEFNEPDPHNPAYSMTEYDLYARLGLSIRKNLRSGKFEIFSIATGIVQFSGSLEEVVVEANRLEGAENTVIVGTERQKPNKKL